MICVSAQMKFYPVSLATTRTHVALAVVLRATVLQTIVEPSLKLQRHYVALEVCNVIVTKFLLGTKSITF